MKYEEGTVVNIGGIAYQRNTYCSITDLSQVREGTGRKLFALETATKTIDEMGTSRVNYSKLDAAKSSTAFDVFVIGNRYNISRQTSALSLDGNQMHESKSAEDRGEKIEDEGIGYFVGRIRNVLPLLRRSKPTAEAFPVITITETVPGTSTAEAAQTMSAERQSHAESDVLIRVAKPTLETDRIEATTQDAIALATNNINKLLKNRVGLAVRWVPYSKELKSENYSNCMGILSYQIFVNNSATKEPNDEHCGTKIYIRYYNLRIMKALQSNSQEIQQTRCPATVQYKRTWERACCQQSDDLQPLENYVNLSYDKAFCIEKSSLRSVNASELSKVCKIGKLWTPLPRAAFPVNNSYYQRSDIIKNYEIQRGAVLNNYWIGVERTEGKHWLVSGNRTVLDSHSSCGNHCYSEKILLGAEAYKKYLNKKRHFVCVKDEKWELFSSADSEECLAVCITRADNNSN
uniref:Uncharacterized protein n=1 Tax=Setaria digitata TaxID=48799 RepID=A0A915Q5H1_9BILA